MTQTELLLIKLVIFTLGSCSILADQTQHQSEFYTSLVGMEKLLKSELAILDRLDTFIAESEKQIKFLKRERDRLRGEVAGAADNPIAFVSNPISAFLMTKRLVRDYRDVDALIRKGVGVEVIDSSTVLPREVDLRGVAEGLSRLQDMYKMKASELVKGNVYGHKLGRELTVEECFLIGRGMALGMCFANANQWLREALQRWKVEDSVGVSRFQILDFYSYSLTEVGKYKEALELTNELLEINSTFVGGLTKKKIILDRLDQIEKNGRKRKRPKSALGRLYEKLCRGDYERPVELAPLKQEVISQDPFIAIYHEAISDREIARLIELARPEVKRAAVGDTKDELISKTRISQNTWLNGEHDPIVAIIDKRSKDMAGGLNEQAYELLQVNNYGLGGFYAMHYDWSRSAAPFPNMAVGNRIATLMYYLSDVQEGGATVFPRVNVAVKPRKGTAIFWYNLHRNGKGDLRTLHAACPVLMGFKWVANLWIHEHHQEFVRPCDLDPKK